MGLGTITLLSLLAAPGQAPADLMPWKSASMSIPIDYNPSKKNDIKEMLLYVSDDQGQSWKQHSTGVPEVNKDFKFDAPADGVYWFSLVVVHKNGQRDPADVYKTAPGLKVLFDTKKPVVTITGAQQAGENVTVSWKVVEKNPDWSKFRLEYSTNGTVWSNVPTRPELEGSAQFKAIGSGNLTVRVSMTDAVGQTGEASSPVAGTTSAKPNDPLVLTGGADSTGPAPVAVPPTDRARNTRLPTEPRGPDTGLPPLPPPGGTVGLPAPGTPGAPVIEPIGPAMPPATTGRAEPIGISTAVRANLPPAQIINVTSFKLGYEVEDKGASGVGKAEVWVTRDEGRNWDKLMEVEKPESPLLIDLAKKNPAAVEGIHGLKVVLRSGVGIGREAPKSGDTPDIRVHVDTTAPVVRGYDPVADPSQKDTMVLRWHASDTNLATDPITLEWADNVRGPWVSIVPGEAGGAPKRIANSGSYSWKLPANFPTHKVYLRISARDLAGNVTEWTTTDAILVDLNKPAAVKLNIVGAGR